MDVNISGDMLEGGIDNIMDTFGYDRYSAEKLYNNVRMEIILLTEEFEYSWSHEVYNCVTHLLINIRIQTIEEGRQFDDLEEASEYLSTVPPKLVEEAIEKFG